MVDRLVLNRTYYFEGKLCKLIERLPGSGAVGMPDRVKVQLSNGVTEIHIARYFRQYAEERP